MTGWLGSGSSGRNIPKASSADTQVLAFLMALTLVAFDATPGMELVGKPAPAWELSDWMNSPPLSLTALRGNVVLVRWFTSKECPYCTATAPALNQLDDDFRTRGLVVVGIYHHKDDEHPLDLAKVRAGVATTSSSSPSPLIAIGARCTAGGSTLKSATSRA